MLQFNSSPFGGVVHTSKTRSLSSTGGLLQCFIDTHTRYPRLSSSKKDGASCSVASIIACVPDTNWPIAKNRPYSQQQLRDQDGKMWVGGQACQWHLVSKVLAKNSSLLLRCHRIRQFNSNSNTRILRCPRPSSPQEAMVWLTALWQRRNHPSLIVI